MTEKCMQLSAEFDTLDAMLFGMESDVKVDCPKCLSPNAWYSADKVDVTLRCMCGYHKVVQTRLESMEIVHVDKPEEVTLPRKDTKLHNCMMVLFAMETATSLQVTNGLNDMHGEDSRLTVNEVSSQLTVLRYKGIAEPIENRKGVAGGSTWRLTPLAKQKIGGM